MKKHVSCKQLVHSLSDYVDGTLDESLCQELEKHLQDCDNCQVVVDTLKKTIDLYHTAAPCNDMPEDVRERLYTRLNIEDYMKK